MRFSEEVWDAVDSALIELDQRLRRKCDAPFDDLVPARDLPFRLAVLTELVKLHQEYSWKVGAPRGIEEYLDAWPELREDTATVAELLRSECQTRLYHGESIDPQELERRFPRVCEQVGIETLLTCEANQQTETVSLQVSDECLESIHSGEWFNRPRSLPKPLAPGTMLGRYSVLSVLGRGGMATVYLAQDEELDRVVAVKVLHRQFLSQNKVDKELLRRDARAAARLRHPSVVPVYDICSDDAGQSFIVMEYVKGESLQRKMMRERIEVVEAVDIAGQVADALAAAHRVDLIHRDVKPGNILLDESGRVRVTDFGLAVHLHEREDWAGDCSGTLPYMAPEQISGQIWKQDGRTDVWALGVVLYEMLTGQRPFQGDDRATIGRAIQCEPIVEPRETNRAIPARVAQLCVRCLEKDMDKRNITAAELHDELEEAKLRILRPSRVRRIAGFTALLIVLFAVIWFSTRERPWQPPARDVAEIPTHSWLADCKLVLVADTGVKIDPAELKQFVNTSLEHFVTEGVLKFDSYYREPVVESLRIEGDWVLWEIPLALTWTPDYLDHHTTYHAKSSVVGPSAVTLKLRYAVSADGVFQLGTVSDQASEHLSALAAIGGIPNYRTFGQGILSEEKVGTPKDIHVETGPRQNQLTDWLVQAYRLLHGNNVVQSGPRDCYELYQCPLEVRNYFPFPVTVVSTFLMHQQFDYNYAERLGYIYRGWNDRWSPIAESPDQETDLSIAVDLSAPAGVPSMLLVNLGNDNENESRFRVEGLTLGMQDPMVVQAEAGESVSYVRIDEENAVGTGFIHDVADATFWLYDESPTRIELHSHSVESQVLSRWSYVCGGKVKIESTKISPLPDGNRKIGPMIWTLPPTKM